MKIKNIHLLWTILFFNSLRTMEDASEDDIRSESSLGTQNADENVEAIDINRNENFDYSDNEEEERLGELRRLQNIQQVFVMKRILEDAKADVLIDLLNNVRKKILENEEMPLFKLDKRIPIKKIFTEHFLDMEEYIKSYICIPGSIKEKEIQKVEVKVDNKDNKKEVKAPIDNKEAEVESDGTEQTQVKTVEKEVEVKFDYKVEVSTYLYCNKFCIDFNIFSSSTNKILSLTFDKLSEKKQKALDIDHLSWIAIQLENIRNDPDRSYIKKLSEREQDVFDTLNITFSTLNHYPGHVIGLCLADFLKKLKNTKRPMPPFFINLIEFSLNYFIINKKKLHCIDSMKIDIPIESLQRLGFRDCLERYFNTYRKIKKTHYRLKNKELKNFYALATERITTQKPATKFLNDDTIKIEYSFSQKLKRGIFTFDFIPSKVKMEVLFDLWIDEGYICIFYYEDNKKIDLNLKLFKKVKKLSENSVLEIAMLSLEKSFKDIDQDKGDFQVYFQNNPELVDIFFNLFKLESKEEQIELQNQQMQLKSQQIESKTIEMQRYEEEINKLSFPEFDQPITIFYYQDKKTYESIMASFQLLQEKNNFDLFLVINIRYNDIKYKNKKNLIFEINLSRQNLSSHKLYIKSYSDENGPIDVSYKICDFIIKKLHELVPQKDIPNQNLIKQFTKIVESLKDVPTVKINNKQQYEEHINPYIGNKFIERMNKEISFQRKFQKAVKKVKNIREIEIYKYSPEDGIIKIVFNKTDWSKVPYFSIRTNYNEMFRIQWKSFFLDINFRKKILNNSSILDYINIKKVQNYLHELRKYTKDFPFLTKLIGIIGHMILENNIRLTSTVYRFYISNEEDLKMASDIFDSFNFSLEQRTELEKQNKSEESVRIEAENKMKEEWELKEGARIKAEKDKEYQEKKEREEKMKENNRIAEAKRIQQEERWRVEAKKKREEEKQIKIEQEKQMKLEQEKQIKLEQEQQAKQQAKQQQSQTQTPQYPTHSKDIKPQTQEQSQTQKQEQTQTQYPTHSKDIKSQTQKQEQTQQKPQQSQTQTPQYPTRSKDIKPQSQAKQQQIEPQEKPQTPEYPTHSKDIKSQSQAKQQQIEPQAKRQPQTQYPTHLKDIKPQSQEQTQTPQYPTHSKDIKSQSQAKQQPQPQEQTQPQKQEQTQQKVQQSQTQTQYPTHSKDIKPQSQEQTQKQQNLMPQQNFHQPLPTQPQQNSMPPQILYPPLESNVLASLQGFSMPSLPQQPQQNLMPQQNFHQPLPTQPQQNSMPPQILYPPLQPNVLASLQGFSMPSLPQQPQQNWIPSQNFHQPLQTQTQQNWMHQQTLYPPLQTNLQESLQQFTMPPFPQQQQQNLMNSQFKDSPAFKPKPK